ncbi:MAG: SurA N-terminal domain-containing protein [Deltaproteobacteria bacterium]|nr:SurA N-terminal domain-containing protein [Deltaproteobacteria bacterium]
MRKHAKSWLIKVLIAIIAIVFVFYFGYSFREREGSKIASVNGDIITAAEYEKAYRNLLEALQREYRGMWNENLLKVFDIRNRAMESLVTQKLVSQEAKKIGLDVTKKEIQQRVLSYPAFQFRGHFDESRYRSVLLNSRMAPEDFEEVLAQEILQEKVQQFLTTFSPATEQEILGLYTFANQRVKVSFVQFEPERFKDSVEIAEGGLETFFEENKERYRTPEKIGAAFIAFDPEDFKSALTVSDKEIREHYEDHPSSFKEKKQVKARHILFKVTESATEEEEKKIKQKALVVLEKAREGQDFSELAKKYSEDPAAKDGGDLGYFSENQMVKPFEEAAFRLQKGEISDLVRTPFGYHIIKVEDVKEARTKSLEEVREQILAKLTRTAASDLAYEKALTMVDQMPYQVDLKAYAAEQEMKAEETGLFALTESVPSVGGDERLRQALFALEKNETSEVMEQGGKFYIFQVTERQPSSLPSLAEVKDRVMSDYRDHLARGKAKAEAEAYLQKLKEGKEWSKLAEERKVKIQTTDFFSRQETVKEIGYSPQLHEIVFSMNGEKRYPEEVFENEKGVFVIRWEGEEGINRTKYEEEKKQYEDMVKRMKEQNLFRNWIDNLRKIAKIEILKPLDRG